MNRGLSDSELLRLAVRQLLGDAGDEPASMRIDPEKVDQDRVTVRLPAFLMEAARNRAKAKGMALSRWFSALAQSNVSAPPVLTTDELAVIEASNRELAAIGRNINQIARALNEAHFETERVRLDRLAELSELIKSVRSDIRALIRASRGSWKNDE